jgi:hypothetical protein
MGTVVFIDFVGRRGLRRSASADRAPSASAEIHLFCGVRYERQDDWADQPEHIEGPQTDKRQA